MNDLTLKKFGDALEELRALVVELRRQNITREETLADCETVRDQLADVLTELRTRREG